MTDLYDVVAVNLESYRVRLLAHSKTLQNAEAIVNMAVIRRRVELEFFATVQASLYKEGDIFGQPKMEVRYDDNQDCR